jgi:hypothetical protein
MTPEQPTDLAIRQAICCPGGCEPPSGAPCQAALYVSDRRVAALRRLFASEYRLRAREAEMREALQGLHNLNAWIEARALLARTGEAE